MDFETYAEHDAVGLAAAVAAGETDAASLLETAIARAEAVDPALQAIVHPLHEHGRRRAAADLSGPLAGVPFLVKDLYQDLAGAPATWGCRALKEAGRVAAEDTEYVRRLEAAGLVIFGKTNTPELGAKGITEPEAFTPTRNPWNTAHTPGGSSGGSAAAVAAGVVPAAGANDGGGSIRIPAACCGLFGLKPGRGRTPAGPPRAEMLQGMAVNGAVSRSVRDSAALLDALRGPEPGASFHAEPPDRPYLESAGEDPGSLTIGMCTRAPTGTPVSPEAVAAVEDTARLLESLGHRVEEAEPAGYDERIGEDFLTIWFTQMAVSLAEIKAETGCGDNGFELDSRAMAALGHALRADEYFACIERCQEHGHALAEFHRQYDLFLTPTLAHPPARVGEIATPAVLHAALRLLLPLRTSRLLLRSGAVEQMARENLRWVPFTQLANLTATPAMSVPLHWTEAGLPLGTQFIGPIGGEPLMFRLAGQLERARPWFGRRPAGL